MSTDAEIGWLAGIIDGEGCLYGTWANRHHSTGGNVAVLIRVQATSMAMIAKVAKICDDNGIASTIEMGTWRPLSNRPCHRVTVRRRLDVVKLLNLIRPHLVVKADEADLVLTWYERWGDQRKRASTREDRVVFFDRLRQMKRRA